MVFTIRFNQTIWRTTYEIVLSSHKVSYDSCAPSECSLGGDIGIYFFFNDSEKCLTYLNPCQNRGIWRQQNQREMGHAS